MSKSMVPKLAEITTRFEDLVALLKDTSRVSLYNVETSKLESEFLYGHFKQAVLGDAPLEFSTDISPDPQARHKWEVHRRCIGIDRFTAMHRYMAKLAEVLQRDATKPLSPDAKHYYEEIVACVSSLPEEPTEDEIAQHNNYVVSQTWRTRTPQARPSNLGTQVASMVSHQQSDYGLNTSQVFQTPSSALSPVSSRSATTENAESKTIDGSASIRVGTEVLPQSTSVLQKPPMNATQPSIYTTPVSRRKSTAMKQSLQTAATENTSTNPILGVPPLPPTNSTTATNGAGGALRAHAAGASYVDTISVLLTHLSEREEQVRTQLAQLDQRVAALVSTQESSQGVSKTEFKASLDQIKSVLDSIRADQEEASARRAAWQARREQWAESPFSVENFAIRMRWWIWRFIQWFGRCTAKVLAYYFIWTLFKKFQNSNAGFFVQQYLRMFLAYISAI